MKRPAVDHRVAGTLKAISSAYRLSESALSCWEKETGSEPRAHFSSTRIHSRSRTGTQPGGSNPASSPRCWSLLIGIRQADLDEKAVALLGKIADIAEPYGVTVAIYTHVNDYTETTGVPSSNQTFKRALGKLPVRDIAPNSIRTCCPPAKSNRSCGTKIAPRSTGLIV